MIRRLHCGTHTVAGDKIPRREEGPGRRHRGTTGPMCKNSKIEELRRVA
jgi:hypothetical protein